MESAGSDHERDPGLVRRAIRCDKRTPCSNCRSSGIVCRSIDSQKPPEPRRRVLISNLYEKKIDLIEERLASIEKTLQELANNTSASKPASHLTPSQFHPSPNSTQSQPPKRSPAKPKGPFYRANPAIEQHDSSSAFEGSSSLSAHGAYASAFLESAVSKSSPQVLSSPKINAALSSLKQIVGIQNQRREVDSQGAQLSTKNARMGVKRDIRDLEMPPLQLVLRVLRHIKEYPSSCFGGYMPFLGVEYFIEKCREVYFCADDFSDAAFIITNFCLYSIFIELVVAKSVGSIGEECQDYIETCRDNLEAALASLNILMPANQESIMALSVGAMHALEISKPSVGWNLASTGMHLCQTLGYHRLSSMEHEPLPVQRQKQLVFWSVYTILNMMSLRLGRACPIQNYDISLPLPPADALDIPEPWGLICVLWTKSAIIQSKVYQYLYSPEALQQPQSHRIAHAKQLAAEMQSSVMQPFDDFSSSNLKISEMDLIYLTTDKVSRLSVLTLIYRAIPASPESGATFIPECIETAREALEVHRQCGALLSESDDFMKTSYMHWAILLSPFVPFIVIFCNVITTSNREDLARLEEFIASLQPLSSFSQSIDRLHTLCSILGTVARLYFEANTRPETDAENFVQVGQEFDAYLGALGLPNNSMGSNPVGLQPGAPVHTPDPAQPVPGFPAESQDSGAAQLGNWFWGNQYMMGLLEEDLSQFNPGW
ncbi:transcriptional regulator family: Fungal Specific TF [Penicillium brevicompactum]|uniref:Transcriptional regulator family: Fungal Specific TF n=1 Tax=Penicillium brevicompactum TaxID=5074 RepID=A0A9W9QZJ1_PENBR|nr:transcriptional regulator family: Fungal Specific TF [Penicillium brevicompactum]